MDETLSPSLSLSPEGEECVDDSWTILSIHCWLEERSALRPDVVEGPWLLCAHTVRPPSGVGGNIRMGEMEEKEREMKGNKGKGKGNGR